MRRFLGIAIGNLAEVDSMVATLPDVYSVDADLVDRIEQLRRGIDGGLFAMLRKRP
jgi:hypothetical protein